MLAQHRAHGDIDGAADAGAGNHLSLQVLDVCHSAIAVNKKLIGKVAVPAILKQIGDDAQVA